MSKHQTVVYKENTLGILDVRNGVNWIGVLNGLASIGGKTASDGVFIADDNDIRPATRRDFDTFRVRYHPDYIVVQ